MTSSTRGPDYTDWKTTPLFYAALHLVDGYFERNGIKPSKSHAGRMKLVKRELPSLYDYYDKLYQLSLDARYNMGNRMKDAERETALDCFLRIKGHISRSRM